jgi:hypothetical protein
MKFHNIDSRTNCSDVTRNVQEPYWEKECRNENVRVCEKGWVTQVFT